MKSHFFMTLTLFITFFTSSVVLANPEDELKNNAAKFCTEGVQSACKIKEALDNPDAGMKNFQPPKNLSQADIQAIKELAENMKKCGSDANCLQKLSSDMAQLEIKKQKTKCSGGEKESCFMEKHLELLDKLQRSM